MQDVTIRVFFSLIIAINISMTDNREGFRIVVKHNGFHTVSVGAVCGSMFVMC